MFIATQTTSGLKGTYKKQWIHEWNGEGGKEEKLIKKRRQVHVHWQHIIIHNATCYTLIMINVACVIGLSVNSLMDIITLIGAKASVTYV
jgi:hypothetical protein